MITYDGVPLLMDDKAGEVQAWLDRYQNLDDLCAMGQNPNVVSHLSNSRSLQRAHRSPSPLNYPPPPKPKINSLYWPTGSARWARGYFYATDEIVAALLQGGSAPVEPLPLLMQDESTSTTILANMFMLPPRPISSAAASGNNSQLWLLPLVDERYWWQNLDFGDNTVSSLTTWDDLFTFFNEQLTLTGSTITLDSVPTQYLQPDPAEFTRKYQPLPLLIDAACSSIGMRFVRQTDTTCRAISWTSSAARYLTNVAFGYLVAGEKFSVFNPFATVNNVRVVFPKWREGRPDPNGDVWSANNAAGTNRVAVTKVIHSTAYADFTTKSSTPDNETALNDLAAQIKTDYLASLVQMYDYTFVSLKPWYLTGFDDSVEWTFSRLYNGEFQAQTRIQSRPYNFGEEEQLQQHDNTPVFGPRQPGKLNGTLSYGTTTGTDCYLMSAGSAGSETKQQVSSTDYTVKAFPWMMNPGDSVASGLEIWLEYNDEELAWYAVNAQCPPTGS